MVEAMNMMGYDAMTLGAQDLRLGVATLRERMAEAKFPFLSANLIVEETGELFAKPYVILERGGHKIGVIGLTTVPGQLSRNPNEKEHFLLQSPVETIKRYVEEVAAQADIVILLSHVGVELDQSLSIEISELDIIIGGQSRRLLYPTRFADSGAIVAQAGYQGEWIGMLLAEFDGRGRVISFSGTSVALTPDYSDDLEMAQFVERAKKLVSTPKPSD